MSTALHNSTRPKTFKEVIGHVDSVKSLRNIIKDKRAQVFCFSGPAGTGKTSLARILANEFCDGTATAANIEEIPAAMFTGVDAMRTIVDKACFRAIGASPVKTIILDEAHRLSANAWDALLKATEEPPAHVRYVFCTTNVGKIPKTIMTRCVHIELKRLSEEEVLKILKRAVKSEKLDVAIEVLEAIAEESEGSGRQALVYLEACAYCESASDARKVMKKASIDSKEAIDLCRFLIGRQGRTWAEGMRLLGGMKELEAESIRIIICNYFASAIMGTKKDKDAARLMSILDCFSGSYHPAEKFAPLLLSIGAALNLGD